MTNRTVASRGYSIVNLDEYYAQCVIGGPSAFMIPVTSWEEFPNAVRRKLVLELSGRMPDGSDMMRTGLRHRQHGRDKGPDAPIWLAQSGAGETVFEQMDCLIGEKIWESRRWEWRDP